MSTTSIHRIHCNAPSCTSSEVTGKPGDSPSGWIELRSTSHLVAPPPVFRGRDLYSQAFSERTSGSFSLDLCPGHTTVFDGHLPRTEGQVRIRTSGPHRITVSCECGASLGWTWIENTTPNQPGPKNTRERLWWEHLPADLRAYHREIGTPSVDGQVAEICERWRHVKTNERPTISLTNSSSPGLLLNALSHALTDVPALLSEVERLEGLVNVARNALTCVPTCCEHYADHGPDEAPHCKKCRNGAAVQEALDLLSGGEPQ
ncbi:hypothetical protein EDD29_0138 [Actinocorallia herbida]|uniref:Uncharacterized protein n=1 Tax=Actinocorallia herbida TaxID=58109 RepID=A0A3N1CMW9_9ACTN|nr:hypothetical protein [Actinocorallia herbida]ROO82657.1 hypothetical protein EDD29_0138 [Actinocorallia herbida]